MKSSDVIECLRKFYFTGGAWAVVTELKPSAGYAGENRRIDLYAIECSPSKGMPKHAVEVKVSRADWLRELKAPLKRRMAMAISNYFWIATPPGVVKPEELPPMCGLLEVAEDWRDQLRYGYGWMVKHPAEYRDSVRPTWALVGSLLRRPLMAEQEQEHPAPAGGGAGDSERLDYIERTFSGMTNRERYLPVQMIWGKGAMGRTLREACDKYMARDRDLTAKPGAEGEK